MDVGVFIGQTVVFRGKSAELPFLSVQRVWHGTQLNTQTMKILSESPNHPCKRLALAVGLQITDELTAFQRLFVNLSRLRQPNPLSYVAALPSWFV